VETKPSNNGEQPDNDTAADSVDAATNGHASFSSSNSNPPVKVETKASEDFTSVLWYGRNFEFNKTQAAVIQLLWGEWAKGGLALSEKTIGENIGSTNDRFRLAHVFRKHPAWKSMILSAGKGKFRLGNQNHQ
jgi:hypothetical protein